MYNPRQTIIPKALVPPKIRAKSGKAGAFSNAPRKITASGATKRNANGIRKSCLGDLITDSSSRPNQGASTNQANVMGKKATAMRGRNEAPVSP